MKKLIVVFSLLFCCFSLSAFTLKSRDLQFSVPYQQVINQFKKEGLNYVVDKEVGCIKFTSDNKMNYEFLKITDILCYYNTSGNVNYYCVGCPCGSYTDYLELLILAVVNIKGDVNSRLDSTDHLEMQIVDNNNDHVIEFSYIPTNGYFTVSFMEK